MKITRTATVSLGLLLTTAACSTTSTISADGVGADLAAGPQPTTATTEDRVEPPTSIVATTSTAPATSTPTTAPTTAPTTTPTTTPPAPGAVAPAPVTAPPEVPATTTTSTTTTTTPTAPTTSVAPAAEPSPETDAEGAEIVRAQVVPALTTASPITTPTTVPSRQVVTDLTFAVATCGDVGSIPGDAQGVESMPIDVDDDGVDDEVTTYFAALGDSAGWRLRLDLTDGPLDDIAIEGVGGVGAARILGSVQVDFDMADPATHERELLVQAGINAAGPNLTVFGIDGDGCLFRFQDDLGADLVLPVHDAIGVKGGVMCDNIDGTAFLARLEAEHTAGSMYDASYTPLQRVGTALLPGTTLSYDIDADTQIGWLSQFGDLNCGGIEL